MIFCNWESFKQDGACWSFKVNFSNEVVASYMYLYVYSQAEMKSLQYCLARVHNFFVDFQLIYLKLDCLSGMVWKCVFYYISVCVGSVCQLS